MSVHGGNYMEQQTWYAIDVNLLSDLHHYLQQYYTLGLPELDEYSREKKARDLVIEKRSSKREEAFNKPWYDFKKAVLQRFGHLSEGNRFIPGYSLDTPIIRQCEITPGTIYRRELHLSVSLLSPYYTSFFVDVYRFDSMKPEEQLFPMEQRFLSSATAQKVAGGKDAFEAMRRLASDHFPEHRFVNHEILFEHKIISGINLGQLISGYYPIFSYLFDNTFPVENLKVLP